MKALIVAMALSAGCLPQSVAPQAPAPATVSAEASTYELIAGDAQGDHFQGTAWVIAPHFLATAGHMCLSGESVAYTAISSGGRSLPVKPVAWQLTEADSGPVDLCLLHADAHLAPPMPIVAELPPAQTPVHYVGYPNGNFERHDGEYVGDTDGPDAHDDDFTVSAPADHGASGSAIFTDQGVIGILVRLRTSGGTVHDGKDGCTLTPISALVPLLADEAVPVVLVE